MLQPVPQQQHQQDGGCQQRQQLRGDPKHRHDDNDEGRGGGEREPARREQSLRRVDQFESTREALRQGGQEEARDMPSAEGAWRGYFRVGSGAAQPIGEQLQRCRPNGLKSLQEA